MSDDHRSDLLYRALTAYRAADDEQAENLAKQLLALDEKDQEAHMILGSLYGRQGRYNHAVNQFYQTLDQSPDNPEAWNNIGVMYRALGQLPQAVEALVKARDLDPKNAGVLYNLGNVYKQMGKSNDAVEAYEASIAANPRSAFTYNNLGTIYEGQGDLEKAQDTYQRGLEADPNNPNLRYNLGLVYQKRNELRLARQSFEAALRSRPGWKAGMNNLGVTLQKMGQKEEALGIFQEMVQDDPENPEALNNLGVLYQEMGKAQEAEAHFAQALKVNPRYGRAVLNLDSLYNKEGKSERSLDLLSRYSLLEPDNLSVRLQLAKLRLFQNSPEKAEEDLLAVLNKQPDNLDALRTLGNLYLKTKRQYLAQKVADRIQRIDAGSVDLHMDMALYALNEGETGTAVEEVRLYLRANPQDPNAQLLLANLLQRQNRPEEARKILDRLRVEDPQNTAVLGALARSFQEGGDQKSALELADAILKVQGRNSAEAELEVMMETLEMYEKAADNLGSDLQEIWQRNLRTLAQPIEGEAPGPETIEEQPMVEEPGWMQMKGEEDQPSLLDLGDLNPAILIGEEDQTIRITEEDEILPPDEAWNEEALEKEPEPEPPKPEPPVPPPFPMGGYFPPPPAGPRVVYIQQPSPPAPQEPPRPPSPPAPPPVSHPEPFESAEPLVPEEDPWETPVPVAEEPLEADDGAPPAVGCPEEPEELPLQDWEPPPGLDDEIPEDLDLGEDDEEPEDAPGTLTENEPGKVSDLIGYLEDLAEFLPEDKRKQLEEDTIPLKMERIRLTLTGTETPQKVSSPWPVKGEDPTATRVKLRSILERLKEKLA